MPATDVLNRYLFEELHVRGEIVQLSQSYQDIVSTHNYPAPVSALLGELMAATCLLTATLKFEGEIAVQLQGDGPVSLAVINGSHQQKMRGIARFEENLKATSLKEMLGKAQMVITITPKKGQRYQGIVALDKDTLAECLEHYFLTSEQLDTRIWLFADSSTAQAGGTLIQLLPDSDNKEQQLNDFHHIVSLTETIKAEEVYTLDAEEVLYRLYHQEKVRIFEPQAVTFECSCSEDKCLNAIVNLGAQEIKAHLAEEGAIKMTCDYCFKEYSFDEQKLAPLLSDKKH